MSLKLHGKVIVSAEVDGKTVSNYANCYEEPSDAQIEALATELFKGLALNHKALKDIQVRYENART